jgi:hypothetical protein
MTIAKKDLPDLCKQPVEEVLGVFGHLGAITISICRPSMRG